MGSQANHRFILILLMEYFYFSIAVNVLRQITFRPFIPNMNLLYKNKLIIKEGKIRFDEFDPAIGGVAKGELIEATLYGFYNSPRDNQGPQPVRWKKVELYNFPFEVSFVKKSMY